MSSPVTEGRTPNFGGPLRIAVLFGGLQSFHLTKDVGQLAVAMQRAGADVRFVFSSPEPPQPLEAWFNTQQVRPITLRWYSNRARHFLSMCLAVWRQAPGRDGWILYHITIETLLLACLIKFRKPRSTIVVKSDMDERGMAGLLAPAQGRVRLHRLMHRYAPVQYYTVESTKGAALCRAHFASVGRRLVYAPSGFDGPSEPVRAEVKERLILHVGRLGMPQKNSEAFLAALVELGEDALEAWRVMLLGSATEPFRRHFERVTDEHPWLGERIAMLDATDDRPRLLDLYERAFLLGHSARWESFGLVLLESTAYGCGVVTTDVGGAADIVGAPELGGVIVDGDPMALADGIRVALRSWPPSDHLLALRHRTSLAFGWEAIGDQYVELFQAGASPAGRVIDRGGR